MITPQSLGFSAKFKNWFPFQWEAIETIVASTKAAFLLNAPTGSGKSLISLAVAKLKDYPRSLIAVKTKQLSHQVKSDFPEVAVMEGRSNSPCALSPGLTCDQGLCRLCPDFGCDEDEKWDICHYYSAKRVALHSAIVLTNQAYLLYESNFVGGFSNLDFLVLDEGHLIERALLNFEEKRLSRRRLALWGIKLPAEFTAVTGFQDFAYHAREQLEPLFLKEQERIRILLRKNGLGLSREDVGLFPSLKAQVTKLEEVATVSAPSDWLPTSDALSVALVPVRVATFSQERLFDHGQNLLIMSATLLSGPIFARQVGLTKGFDYLDLPSSFPVENRPINYWPVVKLSRKSSPQDYDLLVKAIDQILELFPDSKGIVHCVSYQLRDEILMRSRHAERFIIHGPRLMPREDALALLKHSKEPRVLLSPSMETGVDLPDDEARFAIVAKLPFLSLADQQVRKRMEEDKEWYYYSAVADLIQASGRVVRHQHDYAAIFILDGQLTWLAKQNSQMFPQWWREAFHVCSGLEEVRIPPQLRSETVPQ